MSSYIIYLVGFAAQLLFAARTIVQWFKSEKAGRVLSPTIFWQLSLVASILMMTYGILRNDFVILLGQVFSYFVYIRNLQYKNAWSYIPLYFKIGIIAFPFFTLFFLILSDTHSFLQIIGNEDIPRHIMLWGSLGQVIFTFRFIYQWIYSEKLQKSVLPLQFWIISCFGSLIIISYAVYRLDPVLFIGQLFGLAIYGRNIYLYKSSVLKESRS